MASLQTPPPVHYPVGRTRLLGATLLALTAAGWGVLGLWALQGSGGALWRVTLAGALCLACNGGVWHFWRRLPQGMLLWDGQHWCFENRSESGGKRGGPGGVPAEGAPEVRLDLQSHLALRWRSTQGRSAWLWLTRASDPLRWADLRRAVYARAPDTTAGPARAESTENASPETRSA